MMTTILLLFLLILWVAESFHLQHHWKISRSMLFSSFTYNHHPSSFSEWSMKDDWILQDQVPKFTVGEFTFWEQLIAATPSLSCKKKEFLIQKCQDLNITCAGPSPPILQQWAIDQHGRVTGTTSEGRTVWLTCHVIGRLEGDPLSVLDLYAFGGGYVEAIGGRVYELGWPSQRNRQPTAAAFHERKQTSDKEPNDKSNNKKSMDWWVPPVTATISALAASTFLSACIGYAAGTSIIADRSGHSSTYHNPVVYSTETLLSEQRAQVQQRIIREQRALETISEKLQQDQVQLQTLIQKENGIKNSQQLLP